MKIPKGFSIVKNGERIRKGDMFRSKIYGQWIEATLFGHKVGGNGYGCPYIRRLKPRKKNTENEN